jgi:hypothetical protein
MPGETENDYEVLSPNIWCSTSNSSKSLEHYHYTILLGMNLLLRHLRFEYESTNSLMTYGLTWLFVLTNSKRRYSYTYVSLNYVYLRNEDNVLSKI